MICRLVLAGLIAAAMPLTSASVAFAQASEPPAEPAAEPTARERELADLKTELDILTTRNAIRDAAVDAVPRSGIEGTVEVAEGAGTAEVMALAARQLDSIGRTIATAAVAAGSTGTQTDAPATGPQPCGQPATRSAQTATAQKVLLSTGAAFPDLSAADGFEIRRRGLERLLCEAAASSDRVRDLANPPTPFSQYLAPQIQLLQPYLNQSEIGEPSAFPFAGPAATLVSGLRIASSVLSYFAADFRASGTPATGLDDSVLAAAVLQHGDRKIGVLQTLTISASVRESFIEELEALDSLRDGIEAQRRTCMLFRADMERRVEAAEADARSAIRAEYTERLDACGPIDRAVAAHTAFAAEFGGSAEAAGRAATVLQARSIQEQLAGRQLLMIDLHATGGSAYTQQNLFSQIGLMPYHITTASVASWRLFDETGTFETGGLIPLYDGYRRLQDIDTHINGCGSVRNQRRPSAECSNSGTSSRP